MTQVTFPLKTLAIAMLLASSVQTYALEEMKEQEMSETTGEGVAFIAENYSLSMGDTDYIKMTSTGGSVVPTGKKAEFYAYGLHIGGTDPANPYGRSVTPVNIGTATNPALIRVYKSDFVPVADPNAGSGTNLGKAQFDVYEIAYPKRAENAADYSDEENLKWSTWIDLLGRDGVAYTDTVTNGTNLNRTRILAMADKMSWNGTYVQLWKTGVDPANPANSNQVAMSGYIRANTAEDGYLRLSADLRTNPAPISTTESNPSNARFGDAYVTTAPVFGADGSSDNQEGFYWKNFDNNMPLGILGYQPSIISTGGASGRELVVELARIPNNPVAYNAAYIDYDKLENGTAAEQAAEQAKMCTPESCPNTATHATLSYQVHTRQKDGSFTNVAENYYGLGLGANLAKPGSAGINVGSLDPLQPLDNITPVGSTQTIAQQGGTYNKFDGMFVQHLKITTKAFD